MFRRILAVNWEASRLVLLPLTVACFGLPLVSVQAFGSESIAANLRTMDMWLPLYPLLALSVGISVALAVWNWDHEANHIYSLSLPVSRAGWVIEKMTSGVVLMLLPCAAFAVSAHLATATLVLPEGLRAYPTDISLRFFYASLVAYSILFAAAAGSVRTTVAILTGLLVFFIGGQLVWSLLAELMGFPQVVLLSEFIDLTARWPGPFHVFLGEWMLVDV